MGHRRVSPVLFSDPEGPDTHHCTLRPDPQRGKTRGPSLLRSPRSHGDLAFTAGTLCRSARGLSSEREFERGRTTGIRTRLSVCLLRIACLGGAPPDIRAFSPWSSCRRASRRREERRPGRPTIVLSFLLLLPPAAVAGGVPPPTSATSKREALSAEKSICAAPSLW